MATSPSLRLTRKEGFLVIAVISFPMLVVGLARAEYQVSWSLAIRSWVFLQVALVPLALALIWVERHKRDRMSTMMSTMIGMALTIGWLWGSVEMAKLVVALPVHPCIYVGLIGGLVSVPVIAWALGRRKAGALNASPSR